ncbi:hypothetical protein OC844_007761, partial [Tilletia horrida]
VHLRLDPTAQRVSRRTACQSWPDDQEASESPPLPGSPRGQEERLQDGLSWTDRREAHPGLESHRVSSGLEEEEQQGHWPAGQEGPLRLQAVRTPVVAPPHGGALQARVRAQRGRLGNLPSHRARRQHHHRLRL